MGFPLNTYQRKDLRQECRWLLVCCTFDWEGIQSAYSEHVLSKRTSLRLFLYLLIAMRLLWSVPMETEEVSIIDGVQDGVFRQVVHRPTV